MKPLATSCFMFLFAITACKDLHKPKQTREQKQEELGKGEIDENNIYTVKEVGWTVALPSNWEVVSKRENNNISERGQKAIEQTYGTRVDVSKLINLISIRKNKLNSFQSNMQPFDEKKDGDYDQSSIATQKLITDVYKAQGIPFDQNLGAVRIDGIMFDRVELKVYQPGTKYVVLEQKLYNALINGYDFSMAINFNNPDDEETLMYMVMSSKFKKTNSDTLQHSSLH